MKFPLGLVLSVIILIIPDSSIFGQQQIALPSISEGTFWQFKFANKRGPGVIASSDLSDGDCEVIYRDSRLKVFALDGDHRTEIIIGGFGVRELRRMIAIEKDDGRKYLSFPLFVGKKCDGAYSVQLPAARYPTNRYVSYEVKRIENIQTPAGNFEALRIEKQGSESRRRGEMSRHTDIYTILYAPQIGSVVRFSFENKSDAGGFSPGTDIELIKFGVSK